MILYQWLFFGYMYIFITHKPILLFKLLTLTFFLLKCLTPGWWNCLCGSSKTSFRKDINMPPVSFIWVINIPHLSYLSVSWLICQIQIVMLNEWIEKLLLTIIICLLFYQPQGKILSKKQILGARKLWETWVGSLVCTDFCCRTWGLKKSNSMRIF